MLVPHQHLNGHYREALQELQNAYQILSEDCITIDEMPETFYRPCVVGFLDKFGVRWGFTV